MEAITLELNAETDWDGTTPYALNRDAATEVAGKRYYNSLSPGPTASFRRISAACSRRSTSSWSASRTRPGTPRPSAASSPPTRTGPSARR
ncbi:hypothetical protein [Nannocystis pusilla]|uniref:hypothetical protein n=1 Tax=Nannocystis pusilla TaxID=889268 RepID=UPI003B79F87D